MRTLNPANTSTRDTSVRHERLKRAGKRPCMQPCSPVSPHLGAAVQIRRDVGATLPTPHSRKRRPHSGPMSDPVLRYPTSRNASWVDFSFASNLFSGSATCEPSMPSTVALLALPRVHLIHPSSMFALPQPASSDQQDAIPRFVQVCVQE